MKDTNKQKFPDFQAIEITQQDQDPAAIQKRIQALRAQTGLSQSKFAARFGISVRTLQQWEQGKSAPPDYVVRMMAYIIKLNGIQG